MPKNIPKRKRAANCNLPVGSARYVPTSPGFMAVLEERAGKAEDKAARAARAADRKAAAAQKKQQPPRKKKK